MIYELELPDGRILEIDGPEGATPEQLANAARQAVGGQQAPPQAPIEGRRETDVQRAQRFQQMGQDIKAEKDPFQRQAEEAGGFQAFGVGVGKGALNIARGLGIADAPGELEKRSLGALEKEYPVATGIGEAAGETAPGLLVGGGIASIPKLGAGLAKSLMKRVALTGGLGAAESAIAARGKGETGFQQAQSGVIGGGVAATAEAALPPILRFGGKILRKAVGKGAKGALIDAAGQPTKELTEALAADGRTVADLVPEEIEMLKGYAGKEAGQAERKAFLESQGFTKGTAPTKAQVERTATAFMDQMEAAKKTGRVKGRLEEQNALLINKFDEPLENMGLDPKTSGNTVYDAVLNKSTELNNQIHDMYKMAEELTGGEAVVNPARLSKQLQKSMPDDDLTNGLVKAIDGKVKQLGLIDEAGETLKNMTVEEAESLVQSINKRYEKGNKNSNRVGRILKDALDDAVTESGSPELFKKARKLKADFHRQLERSNASPFSRRTTSLTADILDETANAEQMAKAIYSNKYRASEVRDLKKFLHSGTESQVEIGKKAWNELKAETVENIKNGALGGAADQMQNQTITRARLQRSLGKIGMDKLKEIFSPEEMKFFSNMEKTLELLEPVPGTATGEGPTAVAVNKLLNKMSSIAKVNDTLNKLSDLRLDGKLLKGKPVEKFIPEPIVGATTKALGLGGGAYAADNEPQK